MQAKHKAVNDMKQEELKHSVSGMLRLMFDYLYTVDENGVPKFTHILAETKGKDLMVMFGILTEKYLLTQGQPTNIVAFQEHKTIDELSLAIDREIKRRGLVKRPIEIEALQATVK
jgi:hypothetical protein